METTILLGFRILGIRVFPKPLEACLRTQSFIPINPRPCGRQIPSMSGACGWLGRRILEVKAMGRRPWVLG